MLRGGLALLLSTGACVLDPSVDDPPAALHSNGLAREMSIVRGRVLHHRTEAPLPDVRVQIQCTGMPAPHTLRTDERGEFRLKRLPDGRCTVCVDDGFDRDIVNFPLRVGMLAHFNLTLRPEVERTRPLTCDPGVFEWARHPWPPH